MKVWVYGKDSVKFIYWNKKGVGLDNEKGKKFEEFAQNGMQQKISSTQR